MLRSWLRSSLVFAVVIFLWLPSVQGGLAYNDPDGGWTYTYNGDVAEPDDAGALDGTWDHNNGSDAWDGGGLDDDVPGGVAVITEGDVTYVRFQDTGNPTNYGFPDPSNRKIFITRDIIGQNDLSDTFLDDGFTFTFRGRLATGEGLDDHHPNGGAQPEPWPADGLGLTVNFDGISNVAFIQPDGLGSLGFALATPRPEENPDLVETGLLLNSLTDNIPTTNGGDTNGGGDLNLLPIEDFTQWHEFWITVQQGNEGTHEVNVYLDGDTTAQSFQVTAGTRADTTTHLSMAVGSPSTVLESAWDLDFISFRPEVLEPTSAGGAPSLRAGDADRDLDFDQIDLVQVQVAAKYLTGQPATWGEGDWDGAPGGTQDNPPAGDGTFNQLDIIGALASGSYLTGPYAAIQPGGVPGDGQTSIVYNPASGELSVDAPGGTELTSINIDSAGGVFTADAAANLGGSFDNDADNNIFKATFGGSFGSVSFGNVAQAGLSQDFVLNDLTAVGSLAGGGALGDVDLVYVPEPTGVMLLLCGLAIVLLGRSRRLQSY